MFVFFSLSMGKRPVYLLPVYPAVSLLLAAWLYNHGATAGGRLLILYRIVAVIAGVVGVLLLITTAGAMWNHDPGWFFFIERLLKAKDRADLLIVKSSLATFKWSFAIVSLGSSLLWLSLAGCLWRSRVPSAAGRLVLISIMLTFVTQGVIMPVIARAKSYRSFMQEVNRRVTPGGRLYLYGRSFDSDPLVFYRGRPIETLDQPLEAITAKRGTGGDYLIMPEQAWTDIQKRNPNLPPPLLRSRGTGPEGADPLVLVRRGS
jgi:hypothetical protein